MGISKLLVITNISKSKVKVYQEKIKYLGFKLTSTKREIEEKEISLKKKNTEEQSLRITDKLNSLYEYKRTFEDKISLLKKELSPETVKKKDTVQITDTVVFQKVKSGKRKKGFAWIENLNITHTETARLIANKQLSFNNFILSLSDNIKVFRLKAFEANGQIHQVHDIYPNDKDYMCVFVVKDESLSLMTLGSKTLDELKAVGYDEKNKSTVPLLFYRDVVNGQFVLKSINLT